MKDLPYHIVVGMPALSPTMEMGTLAEWYVSEGSEFGAGDSLARIETDKASIDFEAQDDGVVAKILMQGNSEDVAVGTPIMVTVEDPEDVAAFADFVADTTPSAPAAPAAKPAPAAADPPAPTPAPPTPAPVAAAAAPVQAATPPPPAPAAPSAVPPPSAEAVVAALAPVLSTSWGGFAKINSPIAKTLSKRQQEYLDKYGTTGFVAL